MIDRLQQFWYEHTVRERYLILFGLLLAVILILWYAIFSPLLNYQAEQQQQMNRATQDLHWMQQNQIQLGQLENNQTENKMKNSTLKEVITESAQQSSITDLKITQSEENSVELQLTAIPFDTLLFWLQQLEQHYGIQVKKIFLTESGKQDGVVTAVTVGLTRKGR